VYTNANRYVAWVSPEGEKGTNTNNMMVDKWGRCNTWLVQFISTKGSLTDYSKAMIRPALIATKPA